MTNEDQIRGRYTAIKSAASPTWGSGPQARVKCIQRNLDAIRVLMEEGELALNNDLGRENALLRNELTEMTLNYNAAEKHARQLGEEIVRKDKSLKHAHSTLVEVRRGYEEDLVNTVALAAHRKKLLAEAEERIEALEKNLSELRRRLVLDDKYIEMLEHDRSSPR